MGLAGQTKKGSRPPKQKTKLRSELKDEEFFRKISVNMNYLPIETVKQCYYELIRVMCVEIKRKYVVNMPDFGTFRIVIHRPRRGFHLAKEEVIVYPAYPAVKFKPNLKMRTFFRNLPIEE